MLLLIASQLFARVLDSNWQDLILTEWSITVECRMLFICWKKRSVFIFICVENSAIHQLARLNSLGAWSDGVPNISYLEQF